MEPAGWGGRRLRSMSLKRSQDAADEADRQLQTAGSAMPSYSYRRQMDVNHNSSGGGGGDGDNMIFSVDEIPDVGGEDLVLNKRGIQMRSRKRTSNYFGTERVSSRRSSGGSRVSSGGSSASRRTIGDEPEVIVKVEPQEPQQQVTKVEVDITDYRKPREIPNHPRPFLKKILSSASKKVTFQEDQDKVTGGEAKTMPSPVKSSADAATLALLVASPLSTRSREASPANLSDGLPVPKKKKRRNVPPPPVCPLPSMPDLFNSDSEPIPILPSFSSSFSSSSATLGYHNLPVSPGLYPVRVYSEKASLAAVGDTDSAVVSKPRKTAEEISNRLKNLLKLPKAHKWVCFEWFYSDIDRVLLLGENDFQQCLRESFPGLQCRQLARAEWRMIRRMLGKPRRCSQSFFLEERIELARRRQNVRAVQQRKRKSDDLRVSRDIPDEIPLPLTIGTKVTARLRQPHDGIFSGTVEGMDTSTNSYRITFDRKDVGVHSVPDYEVMSVNPPETISTTSFALKRMRPGAPGITMGKRNFPNAELLQNLPEGITSLFPTDAVLGGFPARLLEMIVRLSKVLRVKHSKNLELKGLNTEAEVAKAYGKRYSNDLRQRYARCVLELDSLNKAIDQLFEVVLGVCKELPCDNAPNNSRLIDTKDVIDHANQEAATIVGTYNYKLTRQNANPTRRVHNPGVLALVHQLTSLMLQSRGFLEDKEKSKPHEVDSLNQSTRKIKTSLRAENVGTFERRIELPTRRLSAGLCVEKGTNYGIFQAQGKNGRRK